jgi:prevent-host-death family protein
MITASVAELKARLSEFLAVVRGGDDVIITDRGRPVARLTALDPAEHDARLSGLVRAGTVRPPRRRPDPRAGARSARPVVEDTEGRLLATLLEERREGR